MLTPLYETLPEPFDVVVRRPVGIDCMVNFEGRQYSVPFRFARQEVEVRGLAGRVQILKDNAVIAEHTRPTPTNAYWANSIGRRNTSIGGGCDDDTEGGVRTGQDEASCARLAGRRWRRREDRRRFWAAIAAGRSSEDAAVDAGVSPAVGTRWFREAGGMPPSHLAPSAKPPSGRYLSFAEREEIALSRAQGHGVREIARRLGRAPSTISRELRRNAATRGGGLEYRATTAQWHAERAARRPKPAKLAVNAALRRYVQDRLAGTVVAPERGGGSAGRSVPWKGRRHGRRQDRRWARAWSPEQIARRLAARLPR